MHRSLKVLNMPKQPNHMWWSPQCTLLSLVTGISHTEKTLAAHPRLGKRAAELCLLFLTPPAVSLGRLSVASPTLRKGGTEAWRQGWVPNAEEVLGLDLNSDLLS